MKANTTKLTNKQIKLINRECRRTCVEVTRQYEVELDSVTLYVLHKEFGFGKKRLQQFYDLMFSVRREMQEFFDDDDECVTEFAMRKFLKDDGIDVQAMYDAQEDAKRFNIRLH